MIELCKIVSILAYGPVSPCVNTVSVVTVVQLDQPGRHYQDNVVTVTHAHISQRPDGPCTRHIIKNYRSIKSQLLEITRKTLSAAVMRLHLCDENTRSIDTR